MFAYSFHTFLWHVNTLLAGIFVTWISYMKLYLKQALTRCFQESSGFQPICSLQQEILISLCLSITWEREEEDILPESCRSGTGNIYIYLIVFGMDIQLPLVFSLTVSTAKEATVFYKRLASLLSEKQQQPYSITLNWIRVLLGFCLLRSTIQCFWGAQSFCGFPACSSSPVHLI